jgi:hypothetical protein
MLVMPRNEMTRLVRGKDGWTPPSRVDGSSHAPAPQQTLPLDRFKCREWLIRPDPLASYPQEDGGFIPGAYGIPEIYWDVLQFHPEARKPKLRDGEHMRRFTKIAAITMVSLATAGTGLMAAPTAASASPACTTRIERGYNPDRGWAMCATGTYWVVIDCKVSSSAAMATRYYGPITSGGRKSWEACTSAKPYMSYVTYTHFVP